MSDEPDIRPKEWTDSDLEGAWGEKWKPIEASPDLERVLALPRRAQIDLDSPTAEAIIELEMLRYSRGERECRCAELDVNIASGKRACLKRFNAAQAVTLREMSAVGGLIGQIPAGKGKTLLTLLAPLALGLTEKQTAVALIPPSLMQQIQDDYVLIAEHFRVPALSVPQGGSKPTKVSHVDGAPTLVVLSYNALSGENNSDILSRYTPSAIVADEVDGLSDRTSARTMRLMRAFGGDETLEPEERVRRLLNTKFVGWTGSLIDSKLEEIAHLFLIALRKGSPLPLRHDVTEEWGRAINASRNPAPAGELKRFCDGTENVREGFARRLRETAGFIVIPEAPVLITSGERAGEEVGVQITERKPPKIPDIVEEALRLVRQGQRPDTLLGSPMNETLEDPLEIARHAHTIAAGVLLRWRFPKINGEPQKREHIDLWYKRRKDYFAEANEKKQEGRLRLDSLKNVELAAQRYWGDIPKEDGLPEWRCLTWPAWAEIRETVTHTEEEAWLSPWLAEDAAEWATSTTGIAWYTLKSFGKLVAELTNLPLHGGGPGAEERLKKEDGSRSIICSIQSNGRGRNGLQFGFNEQLVMNIPSSSKRWQQLSARTVRQGQTNHVEFAIYQHTQELRKSLSAALMKGDFCQTLFGGQYNLNRGWAGNREPPADPNEL